jgi:putative proteasome-type protease
MIHRTCGERLRQVFGEIPDPDWVDATNVRCGIASAGTTV